ncbi:MAG TPA: MlaD family protein [Rhabdochlamydiaceae bacterium]|nr:MlaD family protein [Rhabdochlamydiaceae bacterium]
MNEHLKNFLIGVFVIAALSLFVSTVLFLKPSVGDMKQTLHVRFADINRISEGTRVLFAGKPVGEVVAIEPIDNARKAAADSLGRLYCYELTLKIDSSIIVYNTDAITSASAGLMGEKVISITPKSTREGESVRLSEHPVYADSIDAFENTWSEVSELAQEMHGTFSSINGWLKNNADNVGTTIQTANSVLDQMNKTMTSLNQGNGTLGKIVAGDELYLGFNAILSKLNTLMNDVNHYGMLFHLNKGWQRTRLQKVNSLNALSNPVNFKTYFTEEVDGINTAMSRLSMLIERAGESGEKEAILQSGLFQRDFAELMRQAEELSDHLRLYNQQLMQATEFNK